MLSLQVAQVSALVESARLTAQTDLLDIFGSIRKQLERTHVELGGLGEALGRLDRLANETPAIAREIERATDKMETGIDALPREVTRQTAPKSEVQLKDPRPFVAVDHREPPIEPPHHHPDLEPATR